MTSIAVVDLRDPDFEVGILRGCREIGFVGLTGHGISPDHFTRMRALLIRLFDADAETKAAGAITRDNYRGFIPLGFFTPNRAEHTGSRPDNYEGYKLHWDCPPGHPARSECGLYGPSVWAPHVPDMAAIVGAYWSACDRLAMHMLDTFAASLNRDPGELRSWHDAPLTNMTLLHYPAPEGVRPAGIHPHKDTNVITFLYPDPLGGLEVRTPDGSWVEPDLRPDAILMNIGEMLELWSGGELQATPHRVTNRAPASRYAYPYFLVPNHHIVVEPLVPCRPGFEREPMPVGGLSAEVWRTNWADEHPSDASHDLGTVDRPSNTPGD